jgi:excisionase family DNA binding protein
MHKRTNVLPKLLIDAKVLVSVDEAAALLSLGRTYVYSLVVSGEIPSVKVGRLRRVPVAALHAYVTRQMAS